MAQIQVLQAADDADSEWQMLKLAKIQTSPKIMYTSSRADPMFIEVMRQPYEMCADDAACEMTEIHPQVRVEKASVFSPEQVFPDIMKNSQLTTVQVVQVLR